METLINLFSNVDWYEIWVATGDTLIMLSVSLAFTVLLGLPLGVLMFLTSPRQLLEWWRPVRLSVQVEVDAPTLTAFVTKNASVVTQAAQNAVLSVVNGAAQVTAAAPGKQLGLDNATGAIMTAVSNLQTAPLKLHITTLQPSVTAPALAVVSVTSSTASRRGTTSEKKPSEACSRLLLVMPSIVMLN